MSDVQNRLEVQWYEDQIKAYMEAAAKGSTLVSSASPSSASTSASASTLAGSRIQVSGPEDQSPFRGFLPAEVLEAAIAATSSSAVVSDAAVRPAVRIVSSIVGGNDQPPRPSSAPPPSSSRRDHWLDSSLAESSLSRYRSDWEAWCAFAAFHRVSALPPDEYAVEQYIVDLAERTRSVSRVVVVRSAINHFCARFKFLSPLNSPYFSLVMRGIRNDCGVAAVPREPFQSSHIREFLDLAWATDDLRVWREVVGHVFCFQQLVRVREVWALKGHNIVVVDGGIKFVNVKSKNHRLGYPQPLFFPVGDGKHCVGRFLRAYLDRMGVVAGKPSHSFICKVARRGRGPVAGFPLIPISLKTFMSDGKKSIKAIGLDPTRYASHSAKRGGALAAAEAGLNDTELTRVGNWASPEMAAHYLRGSEDFRNRLIDSFRT
jgi:hypothetical protein